MGKIPWWELRSIVVDSPSARFISLSSVAKGNRTACVSPRHSSKVDREGQMFELMN